MLSWVAGPMQKCVDAEGKYFEGTINKVSKYAELKFFVSTVQFLFCHTS